MYLPYKILLGVIAALLLTGVIVLVKPYVTSSDNEKKEDKNKIEQNIEQESVDSEQSKSGNQIRKPRFRQKINPALLKRMKQAHALFKKGKLDNALYIASKVLVDKSVKEFSPFWEETAHFIGKINSLFITTDAPSKKKHNYEIVANDSLVKIAYKNNTTVRCIQRINGIPLGKDIIYAGQTLNLYKGSWSIKISKSRYSLIVYESGNLFKYYKVGIGRQNRTPVGVFTIRNKTKEPVWYPPGRVIPFGDKNNVLGTRWIGLLPIGNTNKNLNGYGIHGTWEPDSIGTGASKGCIRMINKQVEELFDIFPDSKKIKITISE